MSMEHVSCIDSAGLGHLITARITAENRGATLKLLRLPPRVHDVLQMTQLLTVFEVYDEEDQAVASFATTA
jgi:anti-sigma B factor antagonist